MVGEGRALVEGRHKCKIGKEGPLPVLAIGLRAHLGDGLCEPIPGMAARFS